MNKKFKFAIDRGGTFTDVFAITPSNKIITYKLLSKNPLIYDDAPTYAIKKIIAEETKSVSNSSSNNINQIDTELIEWVRMGTTVATNALLESKGERFCLLITKGFKDLLYIGNQSRPNLFDLSCQMPNVLYEHVIEVEERCVPTNDNNVKILKELDLNKLEQDLTIMINEKSIQNIAVLLMHSYFYNDHELKIESLAKKLGLKSVSLSHKISPMIRAVPRGLTTCIDAYLTPCLKEYLESFRKSFDGDINVLFMQSDGGLTSYSNFTGCRAILSGPAGGVVGYALTSYDKDLKQPIIGFDMGGTSTDVSR
jgi:5-oxoprolinase (ATP-hydrolysing)